MPMTLEARLLWGMALSLLGSTAVIAQTAPSPDARAEKLVQAMTLDEKIALVNGTFGAALRKTRPNEARIGAGHIPGVPRLGIPHLYESDASLGVANGGQMRKGDVATALPSGLMTAATFDPAIAYAGGAMIGAEARTKGFNVMLAGGANLIRDPWNGRNFEYLSEAIRRRRPPPPKALTLSSSSPNSGAPRRWTSRRYPCPTDRMR